VASTRATFGFLYVDYGSNAWWWEVEELLRKLLLSAVVVLIDEGSPLQVTLAVLVSGWAHVLHAQYKPWGGGSVLYSLQHGALFVTSFVFLMGLLFKVDGVSSSSGTYSALSGIMVTLCVVFVAAWVGVIVWRVVAMWWSRRKARQSSRSGVVVAAGSTAKHVAGVAGAWQGASDSSSVGGGIGVGDDTAVADTVGVAAGVASLARSTAAFVVDNPLRRPVARHTDSDGVTTRSGADAGATGESHLRVERSVTRGVVMSQSPTSRLQRVLSVQRPVQSMRLGEPCKQGSDV
jgi:hypothetical protein